jgi:nucleoside-diphosphate-sugar epimerase
MMPTPQRILVIGGTRFIGPGVVGRLVAGGREVTVFHRGHTSAALPGGVGEILGDRNDLASFRERFRALSPDVVIDMVAATERQAQGLVETFTDVARRVVVVSSIDVYRAYDGLRRRYAGPPDPVPLGEDAPLRERLFPYRDGAADERDPKFDYDKILVERAVMHRPRLAATVLRLPAVYGPGDFQHRLYPYLRRMLDGRPAILLGRRQARWRWSRGYVDTVADAIARAATSERAVGNVYNVGDARPYDEAEWVGRIAAAAGWDGRVVTVPDEDLPRHLRDDLDWSHDWVVDTWRFANEVGGGEEVPPEEAMARTVAWEAANPPAEVDPARFDYAAEDAALASA